jgi:lysophospholipase L1-like esterase
LEYVDPTSPVASKTADAKRVANIVASVRGSIARILLVGDSIAAQWRRTWPAALLPCLNFGYPGDQTSHILWRLDQADFSDTRFQAAILIAGTNNTGIHYAAPDICRGVCAVIEKIGARAPSARIIYISILPRGEALLARDEKIRAANALISEQSSIRHFQYIDAHSEFRAICGRNDDCGLYRPDRGHLSPVGYQVLYRLVAPYLLDLMQK